MSSELEHLIQFGYDATAIKYYGRATATVLFYDYLLTLGDEVEYIWSGDKSWAFWLFVFNRYFPMVHQLWQVGLALSPHSMFAKVYELCDKTAWFPLIVLVICTLLAQVMFTVRLYAITLKNTLIAIGFAVITVSQLALGIYLVAFAARGGAISLPLIPLDAYRVCIFFRHKTLEVIYTAVSLFYDSLAFLVTIFFARRQRMRGLKGPTILEIIARDAARYFLIIFTAHFSFELVLGFGRESIQLLLSPGLVVYLPVMVSRLMLSLRKAAHSQQNGWPLGELSMTSPAFRSMNFYHPRRGPGRREIDVSLDEYSELQVTIGTQI